MSKLLTDTVYLSTKKRKKNALKKKKKLVYGSKKLSKDAYLTRNKTSHNSQNTGCFASPLLDCRYVFGLQHLEKTWGRHKHQWVLLKHCAFSLWYYVSHKLFLQPPLPLTVLCIKTNNILHASFLIIFIILPKSLLFTLNMPLMSLSSIHTGHQIQAIHTAYMRTTFVNRAAACFTVIKEKIGTWKSSSLKHNCNTVHLWMWHNTRRNEQMSFFQGYRVDWNVI